MDKILTHDAVINNLSSGMTIGVGGWGARRKPMSCAKDKRLRALLNCVGECIGELEVLFPSKFVL